MTNKSEENNQAQGLDPELTAAGICCEEEGEPQLQRVEFVDDPQAPRGRGRLDLTTGERF